MNCGSIRHAAVAYVKRHEYPNGIGAIGRLKRTCKANGIAGIVHLLHQIEAQRKSYLASRWLVVVLCRLAAVGLMRQTPSTTNE